MMRRRHLLGTASALALPPWAWAQSTPNVAAQHLAQQAHGWASVEGATLGGAGAAGNAIDVRSKAEVLKAFELGTQPKWLRIQGLIDLSDGKGPEDFRDSEYDLQKYCEAYNPTTWGKKPLEGPLEEARKRSATRQARAVVMKVPSNTTIVGATPGSGFTNGALLLDGVQQVVIRGLFFGGVLDHFPEWDPNDGQLGEWNSDYDCVSLRRSHHVWFDHCHFQSPKVDQRVLLNRPFEQTDGLLDMTRSSDCITVSWCRFSDHNKTMLIGGSDKHVEDRGKLRVTLDHNLWENCAERTPRVRFGQVHLANNLFLAPNAKHYGYSIGLGFEAQILSVANAWEVAPGIGNHRLLRVLRGGRFTDVGSSMNRQAITWPSFEGVGFEAPVVPGLVAADEVAELVRAHVGPTGWHALSNLKRTPS